MARLTRKIRIIRKGATNRIRNNFKSFLLQGKVDNTIKEHIKKEKGIIYGGQSIKKQIGIFGRPTLDYDVNVKNPKKSANKLQKKLDKVYGKDQFYAKKGVYKSVHKVMDKGPDGRKGTKDDIGIVDFTPIPKPKPSVIKINGIQYRRLRAEVSAKRRALKDKTQAFRHKKDMDDMNRIRFSGFGR